MDGNKINGLTFKLFHRFFKKKQCLNAVDPKCSSDPEVHGRKGTLRVGSLDNFLYFYTRQDVGGSPAGVSHCVRQEDLCLNFKL